MTRRRTNARRHNLTPKQRRAKEAAKPQPETYTPEEAEAMRVELKRRLDRLARVQEEERAAAARAAATDSASPTTP